jgi:putative transposase
MIEKNNKDLSVVRQSEMLSIHRSGLYYKPCEESSFNIDLMKVIDEQFLEKPFYGVARMAEHLNRMGYLVNVKRIRRLYRLMDLRAIFPAPRTTQPNKKHKKYPYLLRDLIINRPNQVWACDITYIPMRHGFMYLVAIIDLYSRFVVNWGISNSLESDFCIEVLKEAINKHGRPAIFNTDQGVQFTCQEFIEVLENNGITISMDGKGRAIDNIFIERLWRSVKYEDVYLHAYDDGLALYRGMQEYFDFYNYRRVHQGLDYKIPGQLFQQAA